MSSSEVERLVCLASKGEQGAVEKLFRGHRKRLKQMICLRMDPRIKGRVDPSDVLQEAFLVASQGLPTYLETRPIPFYPWLRRIAWQALIHLHERHLDAGKRSVRREQAEPWGVNENSTIQLVKMLAGNFSTPSVAATQREIRRRVREMLIQLPQMDREVLLQRYVEQLSVRDIAFVLDLSEAAVYKRHARALDKLRCLLEEDD